MKKTVLALICAAALLICGCGQESGECAYVQSVSMLCGFEGVGLMDRYAGIVTARSEVSIEKDKDRTVDEILVSAGDTVTEGQLLFTYDVEESRLNLEKAQLEQQKMEDNIASLEKNKEDLEKQRDKAKEADKLSYTLEIQTCETNLREAKYNLVLQQKQVEYLETTVEDYEVKAPISGKVQSINKDGGYDSSGNELPYMTIMEAGTYRVKGNVDESTASSMTEGMAVIIRSRTDSGKTWHGTLSYVDWEKPVQNTNYYSDEMTASSKYPFYIELDTDEGLLLGQHVYIEPASGDEGSDALLLDEWYIADTDGKAYVWADNGSGKLEKRTVKLGKYDPDMCCYEILSGLDYSDYIAYPDETLYEGMAVSSVDESAFTDYTEDEEYGTVVYDDGTEGIG